MPEILLTRVDGRRDVVPATYPNLPDRYRVNGAFRAAVGYRRDDDAEPVPELYNGDDALAVMWASIGLCWAGHDIDLPRFRDLKRDVVAYGEAVATALWRAGYSDAQEQGLVGRELFTGFMKEIVDAAKDASADFTKAPRKAQKG